MPSYHSFIKGVDDSGDLPHNVSKFKKDQGRQLEAATEEEDPGDRNDDKDQKFNLPIHETTNPVKTAHLSIAMGRIPTGSRPVSSNSRVLWRGGSNQPTT
jgi:hypothetical protein